MYAKNFYYDNLELSDFGFVVGSLESSDLYEQTTGSVITFNKIPYRGGSKHSLISSKYESCFETTFDIVKESDDKVISSEEYREIAQWLNRKQFLPFKFEDDNSTFDVWFNASFNLSQLVYNDKIYGIRLQMTTDSPNGTGDIKSQTFNFSERNRGKILVESDEYGYFVPDMVIDCSEDGNIVIQNQDAGITMQINNCTNGERITIKGQGRIITSTNSNHHVYNDFNYHFLKIGITPDISYNTIVNQGITNILKITYRPIIKNFV